MKKLNPFVLENTDVYSFRSNITNKQYGICIQYPEGYLQRKDPKPLPVIYILDAQWHFPTICAIYGTLHHDRQMPEALIVGITWQNGNLFEQRAHDLTTDVDPSSPHHGGADAFIECLDQEIIPHIKSEYATTDKTVLIGSSYGGVFSYYACLARPNLFSDYIAFGIGVNWLTKEGKFRKALNNFANHKLTQPVHLIAGRGEWEPAEEVDAMTQQLTDMNLDQFSCEFKIVKNAGHALVNPEGFTQGLQSIFNQPNIQVALGRLGMLCGKYQNQDTKEVVEIFIENNQLATFTGFIASPVDFPKKATLLALSDSLFHVLGWQYTFEFKDNQLIYSRYNNPETFYKI
ncbi:alpha/beta hydrolase [Marinicellulosiphila megalodicopiae]|uniref:alpha/beta hydrolase n=1 Tax=Marinicellulosiphila megalodicopiae TaxID=2724896 RepID=UPI003BB11838